MKKKSRFLEYDANFSIKNTSKMTSFDASAISEFLSINNVEVGAPEFHGLLTGHLCADSSSNVNTRYELYQNWIEARLEFDQIDILEKLHVETLESLEEFSDFEFRVLLPDDGAPIAQRSLALSKWCSGFLSGFGSVGRHNMDNLGEDATEILTDFARIAGISDEVTDGEENEVDLMEILEYVRISVLLIFTECAGSGSPQRESPLH
mgnify:CR=1 FL=1